MKYLPERVILSLVLCLGTINMLAQRVNLSIAILCMTSRCTIRDNNSTSNKYPIRVVQNSSGCSIESFNETKTVIDGLFDWDRSNWGVLLGVIFWGYFLGQIPAGILIQKFSVRSVLLTSLILMSTSTILVPVVAIRSLYLFCAVRVLTGLTSASWFPGFYQLWAAWAPPNERGLLIGFAYAGAVSFVYCMIWFMFVYDEPKLNPRISMKEKTYLESTCPVIMKNSQGKIPIKSILTSLPVWAFIVVNIGIDWNLYTFLTSVPTYMREVLHFDFQQNALLSSLPYIGMWIGQLIFGWISDILLTRRILTLSVVRKLMNSIGMFGPALLMILITLFDYHNKYAVVILLTFGLFLSSGVFSGGMLSPIEITPKYSGLLFSASNSLGALTGFLSPVVANALTPDKTYEQWRYVFYLGSVIFLIAGFIFLIFSSSNIQSWAIEVIDYDDDDDVADNHHSLTDKSFSPTICQINKENIENEHKEFDQIHFNVVSIT
ncbi:unnamed protein product [Schistosoma haematobium]|nr:unnamed protein product [Schistosoma haematobium]